MQKEERKAKYQELAEYLSKAKQVMDEIIEAADVLGPRFEEPLIINIYDNPMRVHKVDGVESNITVLLSSPDKGNETFEDMVAVKTNDGEYPYTHYQNIGDVTFFYIGKQ